MTAPKDESRQCTAKAKSTQKRCQQTAIVGGRVCRMHGGSAPQVKRAAAVRMRDLIDPAIATLARVLVDPLSSETAKLRAVENVLDRAGMPRSHTIDTEQAKRALLERLEALAEDGT